MRAALPALALLLGLSVTSAASGQTAPAPVSAPVAQPSPSAPAGPAPAQPNPNEIPDAPPGYYMERRPDEPPPPPPEIPTPPQNPPAVIYEPPPPGTPVYEPPPPPLARHISPRTSLWVGARVGWFIPFGTAYSRGSVDPFGNVYLTDVALRDYVSSGPAFELDAGVRLSRYYQIFGIWQRAELSSGSVEKNSFGGQRGGDSDFFAAGLRATTDADRIGLVTEIALGYRQARARWADGTELRMTGGVLEGRVGLGAEMRMSPVFTLSPMLELGLGAFDHVRQVVPGGGGYDLIGPNDATGSHGWFLFGIGGTADLFGVR